jgi:hypothetical protein
LTREILWYFFGEAPAQNDRYASKVLLGASLFCKPLENNEHATSLDRTSGASVSRQKNARPMDAGQWAFKQHLFKRR